MLGISTFHCISGLQVTDVNHDARISALEENGGGSQNGKQMGQKQGRGNRISTTQQISCPTFN